MVDTVNGKVRLRAWPKKRGPNIPEQTRLQVTRFQEATKLIKQIKGGVMNKFIDATKQTSLYPRDLAMKLMLAPPVVMELDNGYPMQFARPILEPAVFQGFRLQLDANMAVPANTLKDVIWPAPILDTAGMFSAGSPTIVTIPNGVTVMEFVASYATTNVASTARGIYVRRLAPSELIIAFRSATGAQADNLTTGPVVVDEGETYAMTLFWINSGTATAPRTFFTGTILQAD